MKTLILMTATLVANASYAQTAATDTSKKMFYVDPGLVQSVYAETREAAHHHTDPWAVSAAFGVRQTSHLNVSSDLYEVNYGESREYLPQGEVAIQKQVWSNAQIASEISLHVGYTSYRDTVEAVSENGVSVEDNMVLQIIPVSMRHTLSFVRLGGRYIKPQLMVEASDTWLHQSGSLDGMETSSWLVGYGAGVGAVILSDESSGFGGLTISSVATKTTDSPANWTHMLGSRLFL